MNLSSSHFTKTVVILGLARTGLAAAKALLALNHDIVAWDDSKNKRINAAAIGIPIQETSNFDWTKVSLLIPSPGIPLTHPVIVSARKAHTPVLGDSEVLWRAMPGHKFVGITGTNGKSTTTSLIGHILEGTYPNIAVGGNLGTPALGLSQHDTKGFYILEMSSFQLDLLDCMSFDVGVLLNIAPDHLDRHGTLENYVAAKEKIFNSGRLKTAVIGIDSPETYKIYKKVKSENTLDVIPISCKQPVSDGIRAYNGMLEEHGKTIFQLDAAPNLPGEHNLQNIAAAYAVTRALGVDSSTICKKIRNFSGLSHRLELISNVNGIQFINDSKATNIEAAAKALACYNNIYWIAGGRSKMQDFAPLNPYLNKIVHAFLIGECERDLSAAFDGLLKYTCCGTLVNAFNTAIAQVKEDSRRDAIILLSPACSSFDQFSDFENRGDSFRSMVSALGQETLVQEQGLLEK